MSFQITNGRFQAQTNDGDLLVSGRLYTYVSGTTTFKATYTDSTLATPNTYVADGLGGQYVALNARGEAHVWLGSGTYTLTLKDSAGVTIWTEDGLQDPSGVALALETALAASGGAALVGFIQGGSGAIARNLQTKTREVQVNVADYTGWDPTGGTTSDVAIQSAIDYVSGLGGGTVWFPVTSATFGTVRPKSNVTLRGHGSGVHLRQIQPATDIQTGFYKAAGQGSITDFHVRGLNIDGGRVEVPDSVSNHIFQFDCGTGESVTDVSWHDCQFKNAQEDCIRVVASSTTSGVSERITVRGCKAWTEDASLFEGTNRCFTDLVRIEQTWDWAAAGSGYPTFTDDTYVYFKHIDVSHNYCEKIRTCADLKRGCKVGVIAGNRTKNMYDCHQSVDGSANITIIGNTGEQESGTTITPPPPLAGFTNFIEAQGEHIVISSNTYDGGGRVLNGIYVHDYGRPVEGSNRGHQPVCVIMRDNAIRSVMFVGFKLNNGIGCSIEGGIVDDAGSHVAACSSGDSRNAADGVTPLVAHGAFIGGVQSRNCSTGVAFSNASGTTAVGSRYAPCPDQNGEDFYDIPSVAGVSGIRNADTFTPFLNDQHPVNLCANQFLALDATPDLLYFTPNTLTSITAVGPPNGSPIAMRLEDNSAFGILSAPYSATPLFSVGQRCYITIAAKYNTSLSWSIQVDELNSSSAIINSYYYGRVGFDVDGTAWADYCLVHEVVASLCVKLKITINPAASFAADGARVGKTDFANLRISRVALGVF